MGAIFKFYVKPRENKFKIKVKHFHEMCPIKKIPCIKYVHFTQS